MRIQLDHGSIFFCWRVGYILFLDKERFYFAIKQRHAALFPDRFHNCDSMGLEIVGEPNCRGFDLYPAWLVGKMYGGIV